VADPFNENSFVLLASTGIPVNNLGTHFIYYSFSLHTDCSTLKLIRTSTPSDSPAITLLSLEISLITQQLHYLHHYLSTSKVIDDFVSEQSDNSYSYENLSILFYDSLFALYLMISV